jgi:hypothetical protein
VHVTTRLQLVEKDSTKGLVAQHQVATLVTVVKAVVGVLARAQQVLLQRVVVVVVVATAVLATVPLQENAVVMRGVLLLLLLLSTLDGLVEILCLTEREMYSTATRPSSTRFSSFRLLFQRQLQRCLPSCC